MSFGPEVFKQVNKDEICRIERFIINNVAKNKKEGVVLGLSGGIDSALASSIAVSALGKENVLGLILPERDSSPISQEYAEHHARLLGIEHKVIDITSVLEAFGSYEKRDTAIRSAFSEYDEKKHKVKITLPPNLLQKDSFNIFTLKIEKDGKLIWSGRLKKKDLNQIVAATDTKQRTRMMTLYYNAESKNRLVCGTTNRTEMLQGLFVKYGDGGVDIEPIEHLYKTQVFELSREMNVPQQIINRVPSPDTFPSTVSDEEFFLRIPYSILDLLLYAWENKVPMNETCAGLKLSEEQVKRAYRDFSSKFNATNHLRELPPNLL